MDERPYRQTINRNVSKHRCPICNHTCHYPRLKSTATEGLSIQIGRPPLARERLLETLRTQASKARPMTAQQLAEALNVSLSALFQSIYRARRDGHADIKSTIEGGYYIR